MSDDAKIDIEELNQAIDADEVDGVHSILLSNLLQSVLTTGEAGQAGQLLDGYSSRKKELSELQNRPARNSRLGVDARNSRRPIEALNQREREWRVLLRIARLHRKGTSKRLMTGSILQLHSNPISKFSLPNGCTSTPKVRKVVSRYFKYIENR